MKHAIIRSSCLLALIVAGRVLVAQDAVEPRLLKGWQTISPQHALADVQKLAGKEFGGRFTGHPQYTAAARWAAGQFRSWGLKPIDPKQGYLQPYASPYSVIDEAKLTITVGGKTLVPAIPRDFMPLLFSDTGSASGGVVFAGWGIHAPDLGYDDYADLDVKGKFVVCFRGTPDGDAKWTNHDEHRTRMKVAHERGALGIVYIYPEVLAHPNGDLIRGFHPAMISETMGEAILAERNVAVAALKKQMRDTKKPVSMPLGARFDLIVKARHVPDAIGYNIAAYVEGTDAALTHECVVLGAHFDGVGEHLGILFPGADDNASGSAVVMEAAEAFAANGERPKRSVLFVLFGGEEQGIKGSAYFVEHLPAPFTKVTAMVNFDMEGVGDKASASVSAPLEDTRALLQQADSGLGILTRIGVTKSVGVRSGDIGPFFAKGFPVASFFSSGPRPAFSYHLPGDSIDIIHGDIMANIARVAYRYAFQLADR
jgi:hypothetical protein